ncbi:hypothetical protein GCM10022271_22970 [Corallibacter vietnamensis]|uniref:SGNH/GDSL hydrolase family protein n=2 Tax=Corallibacter TaxID=1511643 RepID=A0ABP7HB57_9FLAO
MRNYLVQLLKFTIIPILFCVLVFVLFITKKEKRKDIWHDISISNKIILMGDSEIKRIPPSAISDSTYNYATIAEHHYFTYLKLKNLLSYPDSNINTVVLGLSVHNFAPIFEKYFSSKTARGNSSFERYLYDLPYKNNDFIDFFSFQKKLVSYFPDLLKDDTDWGYVESLSENPSDKIVGDAIDLHYNHPNTTMCLSQLEYLEKIVNLCTTNNIRLVVVSMPVHFKYKINVEEKYYTILADFIKQNPDIEYQNYLHLDIDSKYMADGNHLNTNGGILIGNYIKERLKVKTRNSVYTK